MMLENRKDQIYWFCDSSQPDSDLYEETAPPQISNMPKACKTKPSIVSPKIHKNIQMIFSGKKKTVQMMEKRSPKLDSVEDLNRKNNNNNNKRIPFKCMSKWQKNQVSN